ncbi:MAG TPA: type II/IV secretion system protein [Bacteroidales bacterium]|nr:type II/IV secretion system protein [Bacteroidales bacterium]
MSEIQKIQIRADLQQLLTSDQAWHYRIIPVAQKENSVEFLIDESQDCSQVKNELEVLLGKNISLVPAVSDEIQMALAGYYRKSNHEARTQLNVVSGNADNLIENLISEAREIRSSDIHLEPYENYAKVRYRVDGKLIERYRIQKAEYPSIVNRIKIKAHLDIAEKRLPQDGRISFRFRKEEFDIRVSVLPTLHGEKIVLRILASDAASVDIATLGFSENQLSVYLEEIRKTQGIIMISGPTGSGKTTTLYATLRILNQESLNILTIEDPIEYTIEGVNQVQLKESIGLSFSSTMRTFLRQDPDIIMLGEIRDGETAQMATRAALTGHLVLSTVHTNSAWGTVDRLIDMGIPPFLLSATLNISIAQRLVRLLCPYCKTPVSYNSTLFPPVYKPKNIPDKLFEAVGCEKCYYTGYSGRKAIYEIIPVDQELRNIIRTKPEDASEYLKSRGISTLADQAFSLLASGQTSAIEIYPHLMNNTY